MPKMERSHMSHKQTLQSNNGWPLEVKGSEAAHKDLGSGGGALALAIKLHQEDEDKPEKREGAYEFYVMRQRRRWRGRRNRFPSALKTGR